MLQLGLPSQIFLGQTCSFAPEAVFMALVDHGHIAIVSDEPVMWNNAAGRYSSQPGGAPPVEVFLSAYSGSPIVLDRRGVEGVRRADSPALTMLVMGQPTALGNLVANKSLRTGGFFGRWIIAQPPTTLGSRDHYAGLEAAKVSGPPRAMYAQCVTGMAHAVRAQGQMKLTWEDKAVGHELAWRQAIEADLGSGQRLHALTDFASKRQGDLARVSALLHIAHATDEHGKVAKTWLKPIPVARVKEAIEIVDWAMAHSAKIVDEEQLHPMTRHMRRALEHLRRTVDPAEPWFTRRSLFSGLRSSEIKESRDVVPVLDALADAGWVAPKTGGKAATGRPSEQWWVHRDIWK
jgi:hypothetical protein